jgi:AcrR family transcriptional regulator
VSRTREAGERSARKRADVLAAACRVVAERGADATRFLDVTAATGVGVSTLQYYFGSREEMLLAVFRFAAQNDFDAMAGRLDATSDPWERLLVIASHLTGAVGSGTGWRIWVESWRWALRDGHLRGEVLGDYRRRHLVLAAIIEAGVARGRFATATAPIDVARQALALIDGLALPVALGDPQVTAAAAGELIADGLGRLVELRPIYFS